MSRALAPASMQNGGAPWERRRSLQRTGQSQQRQPLHFPQHGPSLHPHEHVHLGSSQQQAASVFCRIVPPGSYLMES
jgi:hypothetical protein